MLDPDKAKQIILEHTPLKPPEKIPLEQSVGLVLQEDIKATCSVPDFDNSAMDGYAVIANDLKDASEESPIALQKLNYIPAGKIENQQLLSGSCYQIATGAPVPSGADTIVMKENVRVEGSQVWFTLKPQHADHIRLKGDDIQEGEVVLNKDEVISPGHIGVLAAFGYSQVLVRPPLKTVMISTGSELVTVDQPLEPGKIRDTNSYTLKALAEEEPCECRRAGIIRDDPKLLYETLKANLKADMIFISGGVSVGEHDFVKDTLKQLGVKELFWKVRIKPGKPLFFGKTEHGLVFGMPGNPASSYVGFEEFVRPAIRKALGYKVLEKPLITATLENRITERANRRQYLRAVLREDQGRYWVKTMPLQGSHSMRSLSGGNSFVIIPENSGEIPEGEQVTVRLLDPICGK